MATSKLQEKTKLQLKMLLNKFEIIENIRPDWLKNPITGRNLEIDLFIPEVKIGIEVQGIQHDKFTPGMHSSVDDFEYQVQRDKIKKDLCAKNDVYLYEVRSPDDIASFIDTVAHRNRELGYVLWKKHMSIAYLPYVLAEYGRAQKQGKWNRCEALQRRIFHLVNEFCLPLENFKPDYSLKKTDIVWALKPKVMVYRNSPIDPNRVSKKDGYLIKVQDNIARVSVLIAKDTFKEFKYDIFTCDEIEGQQNYPYKLDKDTLPQWVLDKIDGVSSPLSTDESVVGDVSIDDGLDAFIAERFE